MARKIFPAAVRHSSRAIYRQLIHETNRQIKTPRITPHTFARHPYLRQLAFFDPSQIRVHITVIGAGGIGSWAVMQLAKLGVQTITVYDHDRVAPHNLSTTPYRAEDIGQPKVVALRRVIAAIGARTSIIGKPEAYTRQSLKGTDILISAVDSMAARRNLFKQAQRQKISLYVDGRIGGENLRVYAIRPGESKDRRIYRATLVPDHRVSPLPCAAQLVIDVGWVTASMMTRAVRQFTMQGMYSPELILKQDVLQMIVATPERTGRRQDGFPHKV